MAADSQQRELLRLRLAAHGIGGTDTPLGVLERMLAVQAQDFAAARWGVGIRSGVTDAAVLAAFDSGDLVRAWTMRGTLFAVPAVDLGWMLSLTGPRMLAQAATRRVQLGIDDALLDRVRSVFGDALDAADDLSREEVMTLLVENDVDPTGQRGYHLIAHLAQTGFWCWGPVRDGVQRLVPSDRWIAEPRSLDRDEALAEFVSRYLRGHGPATVRDFAGWSKLTLADSRRGLEIACTDGRVVSYDDDAGLWVSSDAEVTTATDAEKRAFAASVHLLPGFDEYYLGYTDRRAFIDPENEDAVVPGANGVFQPTIVAAGRVIGTWRRSTSRQGVGVEPRLFVEGSLTTARARTITRASARYAAFLDRPHVVAQ
ncbi:winged helix DNA-binding domain-containing protein [Orlajensenia leifsoniae]|uniref:Winged helix DNA-binding domain-containing protein n=1 Tax=Orlajensenia leifsoniae TaxID=2561933 RepID=A0A4Y9R3E4_9MICO|nr:winged helix DNA-binding domain-containing protein [Leifsonia flava]TFV99079.1 winged helix DNA-binding domain-containing protein [Leifsonia flava]